MTAEQIEKAIEKIRPEKCDIDGWIVVEYKDLETIRNTIGNLVKENEKLKEELKNRPIVDFTFDVYKELEDYKKRIDKAIEYIKECKELEFSELDVLNILQGSDEE